MNSTYTASALGSLALVLTLSGCGGNDFAAQSADEIVKASIADMDELESVKIEAEIDDGEQPIALDLQLNREGDCSGTVGVGEGKAEVLSVGGDSYFKADEAFFAQVVPDPAAVSQVMETIGDKYIEDTQGQFSTFCDLDDLLENITEVDDEEEVTKGDEAEVDGEDAIIIEGETDEGDPSEAYIATGDKHYILKFTADGEEAGEVNFSEFDEEVEVEAPDPEDVTDLSSIG